MGTNLNLTLGGTYVKVAQYPPLSHTFPFLPRILPINDYAKRQHVDTAVVARFVDLLVTVN